MVDLVERDDGGELLIGEGVDDTVDGLIAPALEGLFQCQPVQGAGDDLGGTAVAGELRLEGLNSGGLDSDVAASNATPALGQVTPDPGDDLTAQPGYVDAGVVAAGVLTLRISGATDVDDVDEGVGVAQVVEELVAQTFALVGAGDKTGDVEQLDGDAALAVVTGTVVGAASVGNIMAGAGAVDLQVAYGALRVDGGESASAPEEGQPRTV